MRKVFSAVFAGIGVLSAAAVGYYILKTYPERFCRYKDCCD